MISRTRSCENFNYGWDPAFARWSVASIQLTDWITASQEQDIVSRGFIDYLFDIGHFHSLLGFLREASRAGEYVLDPEVHASASLSCLKYLSRSRLGVPIPFHHTERDLEKRRNSPWHWKQHLTKAIFSQFVLKGYICSSPNALGKEFWHIRKRAGQQEMYMDATHLALVFLRRALPRSAKSDELVAFMRAEKPFSQRALQFPAKLKKCKAAIATYMARVQSSAPNV